MAGPHPGQPGAALYGAITCGSDTPLRRLLPVPTRRIPVAGGLLIQPAGPGYFCGA